MAPSGRQEWEIMKRIINAVLTIFTATCIFLALLTTPAAAITPSVSLSTLANSVRAAAPANDYLTFLQQARTFASTRSLRVKSSDNKITVWNPRKPSEKIIFNFSNSSVSRSYISSSISSTNRRELELFSALDKSVDLAKSKSSVIFIKTERPIFSGGLPVGSTTARRGSNGDISIITNGLGSVLLGSVLTKENPKNWTPEQRAAFSAVGVDPDASLLRQTIDSKGIESVRSTYANFVRRSIANLIVQSFDTPQAVNVSKTKSGYVYRIRSTVSPTFSPKARGEITTSFIVRGGRITLVMVTPNALASKYGSATRVSINPSSGKVRAISGSVSDFDKVSSSPQFLRIESRAQGISDLQSFLKTVLIADDAAALLTAFTIFSNDAKSKASAQQLSIYGRAVQWSNGSLLLCGRLDMLAGIVIAETDCTTAGFARTI